MDQARAANPAGYRTLVEHMRRTQPSSPLTRALGEPPAEVTPTGTRDVVVAGGTPRGAPTGDPVSAVPDRPVVAADGRDGPRTVEATPALTPDQQRAAATQRGEVWLAAFRAGSTTVTQALLNDPIIAMNPLEWGSGRTRESDAVNASLRLNTAMWTVQRDMRSGTLTPQAFSRTSWNDVTPRDMHALGLRRLNEDQHDWRTEANNMVADRSLTPLRVAVRGQQEPLTITHDNVNTWGWWMDRTPESLLRPNRAATILGGMAAMTAAADGAATIASATDEQSRMRAFAASTLRTAEVLSDGSDDAGGRRNLTPNSTVLTSSLATATGTFYRVEDVPPGATAESIRADASIQHVVIGRNPDGSPRVRVARRIENTEQLGREVQRRLREGELDWLDPATRGRVEMLSRDGALHIRGRENAEASNRWWREVAGTVTETVALTAVTAGVGTVVAGGVRAAGGGVALARAAYIGSQSVGFTALSQAVNGHFDPLQYPIDLAMFGALSRTQAIANRLAGVGLGGTPMRQAAAHFAAFGITNTTASAAGTGVTALREAWETGGVVDWRARLDQFGMGLMTGAIVHGTNTAINRYAPRMSLDGVALRERDRLLAETRAQNDRLPQIIGRYEAAEAEAGRLQNQGVAANDPRMQAVARRALDAINEFSALETQSRATQTAFRGMVERYLPREVPQLDAMLRGTGRAPGEVRADEAGRAPTRQRERDVADAVERVGLSGIMDVGIPPELARAATADRGELRLRWSRIREGYNDLARRAQAGDPVAQRRMVEFREVMTRLNSTRENASSTARADDAARTNIQRMNELTRRWLAEDRGFTTPDAAVLRLRQLNYLATDGLDVHGLMTGTRGALRYYGEDVETGAGRYPRGGPEIATALRDFGDWYAAAERRVAAGEMTPVELAARSYQTLVSIHPFMDGNGRTTRAFMDWVLQRHGLPPATLVGDERNVAHFTGRDNAFFGARDPRVTPDEAIAGVSRGVNRTLSEIEAALYGPLRQR